MSDYINPYKSFIGFMIPNWLSKRNEISQGAKLLYGRLCQYAGKDGKAYPKMGTLGKELGVSRKTISKYMSELESYDLIERKRNGLGKPNSYRFLNHSWIERDNTGSQPDENEGLPQGVDKGLHPNGKNPSQPPIVRESKRRESSKSIDQIAERIYQNYPRKVAKQEALKAIKKSLKDVTVDTLLERVQQFAKCQEGQEKRFIPYPATWFNQSRYEDDPVEWTAWKQQNNSRTPQTNGKPDVNKITEQVERHFAGQSL